MNAGGFDVRALLARHVFIMSNREEDAMLSKLAAAPRGVDAGEVADVVSVRFEPPQHRVLGRKEERFVAAVPCDERPAVAHLVRAR